MKTKTRGLFGGVCILAGHTGSWTVHGAIFLLVCLRIVWLGELEEGYKLVRVCVRLLSCWDNDNE